MIPCFEGRSVEDLWPQLVAAFLQIRNEPPNGGELGEVSAGVTTGRGGQTLELLHAIMSLGDPRQRWAYSRQPALNPAFALAEVLWILAGRQDSAFLNFWNPILPRFAGEGAIYHGAYGWRLKNEFGVDQLSLAYETLRDNPESRQVVLQIWNPARDLPQERGIPNAPDIPCNVCSFLKVRDGRLEWTQVMRSNDLFLGLPHNIVQWTSVQEVMAGWLGLECGSYNHFSDSLHVYEDYWHRLDVSTKNYQTDEPKEVVQNTDSLSLTKAEFDAVFPLVMRSAEKMTDDQLSVQELIHLTSLEAPEGYHNMLRVLAADTARRKGWAEALDTIMSRCSNPSFSLLWERWIARTTQTGKQRFEGI